MIFVGQCGVEIVGAIINRPAAQCLEFAGNQCEFKRFFVRADNIRPYVHHRKQPDKHQFTIRNNRCPAGQRFYTAFDMVCRLHGNK